MEKKALNLLTNYNNKIGCTYFVHLDKAIPHGSLTESKASETIYVINTIDHSHPPIEYQLDDIARAPLKEVPESWTRLSHGMTREQYLDFVKEKKYQSETEMALYYYKKLK